MRCCVPFCKNTSDNVSTSEGEGNCISFHRFPSEVHLRAAWFRALGKQDSYLPDSDVVCSQHFLNDDIYETQCGSREIVTGAIPSTVQVCMICLDTDSKLILMSKHKLEETYEKLTGHPLCDLGNLKQTLCLQCAQRLITFSRFRDKSLKARALMINLVEKHELITRRHIKIINRTKHQLKSSMVLTMLGPDHGDLHILGHPSKDKQTELEEIGLRDVVQTEESDESMSVDGDMEVKHEDDNNVNDFVQSPFKYESAPFQCTLCLKEFFHDHVYMQHMSVHLQNGDGDGECDTSQVCKPQSAVSSSSSHSVLITKNKQADPSPSAHAAQTTVAPVSATFATNKESNAENFKQKLGRLQSVDSKIFTSVVRLCDIFREFKAPRLDQALTKTRKSVSGIQNIAPTEEVDTNISCRYKRLSDCFVKLYDIFAKKVVQRQDGLLMKTQRDAMSCDSLNTVSKDFSHHAKSQNEVTTEYIEPVTNSHSRVKVTVSKTLESKTDDINNFQCNNSSQYSSHIAKSSFICDICGKNYKQNSLLEHIMTHSEESQFTCKICQQKCKFKSQLATHMRTHTGERPFTCNICNSKFAQRGGLERHMSTHTGIKPYACEFCQYKFALKTSLVRHMRVHTGEKPYSCQKCKYKCSDKSGLVNHMRTHTGEKPFICNICNSKFARNSGLIFHMRTHTGIKPYACELCEYKSARGSNLVTHMRTHTGEKPYCCQICEYKCAHKISLVKHMRTHIGSNL